MAIRLDPKIKLMVDELRKKGFKLKGIRNGIRAKLENGLNTDIYTLKSKPAHVRARLRLDNKSEAMRKAALTETRSIIAKGLEGIAEVDEFRFSREGDGIYHYYAVIRMIEKDQVTFLEEPEFIEDNADDGKTETAETPPQTPPKTPPKTTIEQAVAMLDGIDAKTFRKGLDGLGLPRSSILRVTLMHLYRSALDEDELRITLTEESEKITAPSDLAMLERIRKKNKTDFLAPLLQALWDASNQELTIVLD